jgi:hypothetical protein
MAFAVFDCADSRACERLEEPIADGGGTLIADAAAR